MTDQIAALLREQRGIWEEQEAEWAALKAPVIPGDRGRKGRKSAEEPPAVERRTEWSQKAGAGRAGRALRADGERDDGTLEWEPEDREREGPEWGPSDDWEDGNLNWEMAVPDGPGMSRAAGERKETDVPPGPLAAGELTESWRRTAGLYGALRQAAEAARYAAPGLRTEAAAARQDWAEEPQRPGLEELDRALQRDARRYDGNFALF